MSRIMLHAREHRRWIGIALPKRLRDRSGVDSRTSPDLKCRTALSPAGPEPSPRVTGSPRAWVRSGGP